MKRKLNENDVPEEVAEPSTKWESSAAFDKLGLDSRLLQGILSQKFSKPTPIQSRAIPLAFEGKDILGTSLRTTNLPYPITNTHQPAPEQDLAKPPHTSFQSSNPSLNAKPLLLRNALLP